jgi:hypothetical protein
LENGISIPLASIVSFFYLYFFYDIWKIFVKKKIPNLSNFFSLFVLIYIAFKITRYSESNPNKSILATGDTNQLETIDLVSNQIDYEVYTDHCIITIFPNNIKLNENKRLKTQADKEILKQFKDDLLSENIPTDVKDMNIE